ncbi:MAG TPA: hemolysin family protein [Ignavibacteriaceae bacterium]|nr:hemolysin family protein [Ignavibacteriaceae bacterium]
MTNQLIILIVLVLISAFFSGSELAFVVANKLKIEVRARKKNYAAKSAYAFVRNPQYFYSTILIANNVINIAFASLSAIILSAAFNMNEFSIMIISTLVLLLFGELLPKYLARELGDRVVLIIAIPVRIVFYILYPFVRLTSLLSSFLTQTSNVKAENINFLFSKEDIEFLVKESHDAGVVNKKESAIITRVLALGDQKVYEAMRPRTEIVGIELDSTIEEVVSVFIDSGYSKLPVYEENLDNIRGVIFAYDIFKSPQNLQSIIREIIFVPETKRSFEMLNEFLNKQVSIAVVVDEFGGTAGLVTMEDIIEELFGEIKDEYDTEEEICRKIASDTFLISGKVEIDYINEKYNLNIPTGDYETIAGYITNEIGRIPQQGESVNIDKFNFLIARANNIKIDLVKLTVIPSEDVFPTTSV